MQKAMVQTTKRTLKIVTAVLSIWVPGLVKVIGNLSSDAGDTIHNYSHIAFGKLRNDENSAADSYSGDSPFRMTEEAVNTKKQVKMAEIILTRDTKTSGFMEDAELIIQFVIDQATLKMKVVGRKGSCLMNQCFDIVSYDRSSDPVQETSIDGNTIGMRVFFGLNQFLYKFYVKVPEIPSLLHQSSGNVMNTLWRNFMEPMT